MANDLVSKQFDSIKKTDPTGIEYWMARDLQSNLGYSKWENFSDVVGKAMMACEGSGVKPEDHFLRSGKMMSLGKGAQREVDDFMLSRYACYLIAMNGSATVPQIAVAQTYFAVQTRKQELSEQSSDLEKRTELRDRVKVANKNLNSAAKSAGVQHYGLFHDAGYRGLYGMGLGSIKTKKGIGKDDLLDRAGRAELAMNEFRITQMEQAMNREGVRGESNANAKHTEIGREVRETIRRIGGTMPENLPAEPSIKKLKGKKPKLLDS